MQDTTRMMCWKEKMLWKQLNFPFLGHEESISQKGEGATEGAPIHVSVTKLFHSVHFLWEGSKSPSKFGSWQVWQMESPSSRFGHLPSSPLQRSLTFSRSLATGNPQEQRSQEANSNVQRLFNEGLNLWVLLPFWLISAKSFEPCECCEDSWLLCQPFNDCIFTESSVSDSHAKNKHGG
jgi:hypothetical protein